MTSSIQKQIKLQQEQTVPFGTFVLIFIFGGMYVNAASKGGTRIVDWLSSNCYVSLHMHKLIGDMITAFTGVMTGKMAMMPVLTDNFSKYCAIAFTSTFANLDLIQVAGSCYFVWVFGASLEQRIGVGRYLMLAALSTILPWLVLYFELGVHDPAACFYGPFYMLACFIGATFVFPPEKKINAEWFRSSRGNIFAPPTELDLTSKYKFKPNLFLFLFIAYNAAIWYFYHTSYPSLKTMSPMAGFFALGIGYVIVAILVFSATGSFTDGPIRLMTVKMYNDILKLDVGHEVAIRGTSQAMGLPPERVREWVMAQKGKMQVS